MKEKCFSISASKDNKYVEIHCDNLLELGIIPAISFTKGDDPMSMESNVPAIVNHVKQMMIKEGYTTVVCLESNLAVYNEVIAELKYIEGLRVVLE